MKQSTAAVILWLLSTVRSPVILIAHSPGGNRFRTPLGTGHTAVSPGKVVISLMTSLEIGSGRPIVFNLPGSSGIFID